MAHIRANISRSRGRGLSAVSGMGDWFQPTCTPGTPDCVPHWYCYIPGAATPDCLASLGQGVSQITQGAASAAGNVVGSVAGGVASGTCLATLGNSSLAQSICGSPVQWALVGLAVVVGFFVIKS